MDSPAFYVVLSYMVMANLNHVRGGGHGYGTATMEFIKSFPGRPLYYVGVLVGLFTFALSHNAVFSAIAAVGYLLWGLLPWGRMFDLGGLPHDAERRGEPLSDFILDHLPPSRATDVLAMFVRELYAFPFFAGTCYFIGISFAGSVLLTVMYAATATLARIIAMRGVVVKMEYRNPIAELLIGGVWGLYIGMFSYIVMRYSL